MAARQSTCVAIGKRGMLIEGAPGVGKSSLALALIDRGAILVGDDGIILRRQGEALFARPHPNTSGLLEIRNLGLVEMPVCEEARLCLLIRLTSAAPRFIDEPSLANIEGVNLPVVELWPVDASLALKAEIALDRFGLEIS